MIREDGSIKSVNAPYVDNRYMVADHGIHKGVIIDVLFTDNTANSSGTTNPPDEVLYSVLLMGGTRDGHLLTNVRMLYDQGGSFNYSEYVAKRMEPITPISTLGSPLSAIDPVLKGPSSYNGDVVYIQFVNGDINSPLIMGFGKNKSVEKLEATESEGYRKRSKFNGIFTEIDKDGQFKWVKDNGAFVSQMINPNNPLVPFKNEFAPLIGQEEAIQFNVNNENLVSLKFFTGAEVSIDGSLNNDLMMFKTAIGTAYTMTGGTTDSHNFSTAVGTAVLIDGMNDSISLTAAFGDTLSVSAKDGVQISTPTGTSLSMKNAQVDIGSGAGATLSLGKDGKIGLGNSIGDVLDILYQLLNELATDVFSGFGAPAGKAALYAQLATKLLLIKK